MAFTKVVGPGIHTLSNILSHNINSSGIITATKFVGPFDNAIIGGGTTISSDGINVTGIVTATGLDINGNGDISGNLVVGGNLTANGDFTTLNTTLREVELLRVDAQDDNVAAGIITQRGTGDILNLFDSAVPVVSVKGDGKIGIATASPLYRVDIGDGVSDPASGYQFRINAAGDYIFALAKQSNASFSIRNNSTSVVHLNTQNSKRLALGISTGPNSGSIEEHVTVIAGGNVGIGTNDPDTKLEVFGGSTSIQVGNQSGLGRFGADGTSTKIGSHSNHHLDLFTNGSSNTRIRIKNDGNVIIGTTSWQYEKPLNVQGESGSIISLYNADTTSYAADTYSAIELKILTGNTGNTFGALEIRGIKENGGNGDNARALTFYTGANGGTNQERLRIDSSGRVILGGTTSRETRAGASGYHGQLQMESDVEAALTMTRFGGVHPSRLNLQHARGTIASIAAAQDGDNLGQITFSGWDGDTFTNGAEIISNVDGTPGDDDMPGNLVFKTTPNDSAVPVERLRIKADGKVLVGSGVTDASSLNVKGSAGFADNGTNAGIIIDTDGVSGAAIHCLTTGGFQNGSYSNMRFNALSHKFTYGNTTRLEINSSGKAIFAEEIATPQDYPDLRPTIDFNFAAVKKLDPRIKYYRNGPASYVNEFGRVVLVAENEPRFDHDPTTRKSKGLLIEQLRVNFLANSEFVSSYGSGNAWLYGVGTDVFSASSGSQLSTNPDGSSPAYHYAPSSSAGYHRFYGSVTLDAYDTSYVVSVFAKRVTEGSVSSLNRYLEIEVSGNFALNGAPTGHSGSHGMSSVTFDLQGDGAIESQSTTTHGYVGSPKMEKYPNGWWRLSYVFNPGTNDGSSSLSGNIWFGHPDSLANDDGSETGNGNPSFYLWGAMIEKGGHLTSYIPNHGAYNATRGFDNVVVDGDDFTDFYNPAESTALAVGTVQRPAAMQGQLNILNIGDSNDDGHGVFREHGTKDVFYHIRNNNSTPSGGNLNPSGYGDWDEGEEARIAIAFKDGNQAISVNGGNQVTATVTTNYPTANITKMWIGSAGGNGSGQFEGTISRIAYYPKQLTNNQLNTLTAP